MDRNLISKIADEVMRQISEEHPAQEATLPGALVVVSNPVAGVECAVKTLRRKLSQDLLFAPVGVPAAGLGNNVAVMKDIDEQKLFARAAASADIVLLAPKISLLENIVCGRDEGTVENLLVRCLLWGKTVHIMMDFTLPKFKRGTMYAKIEGIVDELTGMGAEVSAYQWMKAEESTGLTLVTENEVLEAHAGKKTRIVCASGAIITPAARDKARELNIKIDW